MRIKALFVLIALLVFSSAIAADTEKRITKDEAVADVGQFFSTLQRVHPDLLAKVSVDDYIKLKQQTLDDIDKNLDENGRISIRDFAYSLYYAAAFFKDAHTSIWSNGFAWPNESNTQGKRFPSFILKYDNGRFIIDASKDKDIIGLEIISINEQPILTFLRPILDRRSGETLAWKAGFCRSQQFWYNFTNIFNSTESLVLMLRDADGRLNRKIVGTVDYTEFMKLSSQRQTTKLEQNQRQGTQVQFYDSGRIAYFLYPAFDYSDIEKNKINAIFEQITLKKSRELIIDLRDNSGGSSVMGDIILRHLHKGDFTQTSKIRYKISSDLFSDSYAKFLESAAGKDAAQRYMSYLKSKYTGLEGMIITIYGADTGELNSVLDEKDRSEPSDFFKGRVFLLVDNGTFSSASMFSATFRDYNIGTILGYETGGLPVSFGDVFSFELANSRIDCGVSWKQFFNPKPRPCDDEHGVIPDIPLNDKLLQPYQKTDDPVLAYTLNYLKADSTPIYWQP